MAISPSATPRVTGRPRRPAFLPFAMPDLTEAEIEAVVAVLRRGWLTTGPEVQAFQQEFAEYVGVEHAVAVNSCTAALHLALEAAGVGPGDEVLTATITFTATAEVVEYLGARTRFVDVGRTDLNLDAAVVREVIEREYARRDGEWRHRESGGRLKALVPVCTMAAIPATWRRCGPSRSSTISFFSTTRRMPFPRSGTASRWVPRAALPPSASTPPRR